MILERKVHNPVSLLERIAKQRKIPCKLILYGDFLFLVHSKINISKHSFIFQIYSYPVIQY